MIQFYLINKSYRSMVWTSRKIWFNFSWTSSFNTWLWTIDGIKWSFIVGIKYLNEFSVSMFFYVEKISFLWVIRGNYKTGYFVMLLFNRMTMLKWLTIYHWWYNAESWLYRKITISYLLFHECKKERTNIYCND